MKKLRVLILLLSIVPTINAMNTGNDMHENDKEEAAVVENKWRGFLHDIIEQHQSPQEGRESALKTLTHCIYTEKDLPLIRDVIREEGMPGELLMLTVESMCKNMPEDALNSYLATKGSLMQLLVEEASRSMNLSERQSTILQTLFAHKCALYPTEV